jgi:hypothetical protein
MKSRQGYPQPAAVCPSNKPKNRCYFNERIEQLLNQARKYKVGLALGRSTSGFTRPTACLLTAQNEPVMLPRRTGTKEQAKVEKPVSLDAVASVVKVRFAHRYMRRRAATNEGL